jgi:hypothetical protein
VCLSIDPCEVSILCLMLFVSEYRSLRGFDTVFDVVCV